MKLNFGGLAFDRVCVPKASMERYRGKIPDQLLVYCDEQGWCGYAEGAFWTGNPQDYEPALGAWIGNTAFMEMDAYQVIARSAFGDLYFWGERTGITLKICALGSFAPRKKTNTASLGRRVQLFSGTEQLRPMISESILERPAKSSAD